MYTYNKYTHKYKMSIFQFSLLQLFLHILLVSSKLLVTPNEPIGKSTNKLTDESLSMLKQDKDIADMYVFAYIWEPESCYTNPSWLQCTSLKHFGKQILLFMDYGPNTHPEVIRLRVQMNLLIIAWLKRLVWIL